MSGWPADMKANAPPPGPCTALLRAGSSLLALSALGLLVAPAMILSAHPDLATRAGRHTLAGALALIALAVLEFLLAVIPIRRGEKWAIAAAAVPFLIVGVPVLIVDATRVAPERLLATLAPQVAGLALGLLALALCAIGCRRGRR